MANKQDMKVSEARILIYLNQVDYDLMYLGKIATVLKMDYAYCMKILKNMHEAKLLIKHKKPSNPSRAYYHLAKLGKDSLDTAIEITGK